MKNWILVFILLVLVTALVFILTKTTIVYDLLIGSNVDSWSSTADSWSYMLEH